MNKNWELIQEGKLEIGKKIFHCDGPIHFIPKERVSFLEVMEIIRVIPEGERTYVERGKTYISEKLDHFNVRLWCHHCNKRDDSDPYILNADSYRSKCTRYWKGTQSLMTCGCWNVNKTHGLSAKDEDGRSDWHYLALGRCRYTAKKEGLPFDMTLEEFRKMEIPKYCPVLGIPIIVPSGDLQHDKKIPRVPNSPSVDKFYPELGYVMNNIQIISWRANDLKKNGTPEEWGKIAEWCKKEDIRMRLEGRHPDQQKKKT